MFQIRGSVIFMCGAIVLAAGCGKEAAPPRPPPVEVTVLKIEPRDTPIVFEYIAQTQSPQQVNIVARVNGFLDKQVYTEGAIVKEGQVLFQMDQKPFIAQVNDAKAALGQGQGRARHRARQPEPGQAARGAERAVEEGPRRRHRLRAVRRRVARRRQGQRRHRAAESLVYDHRLAAQRRLGRRAAEGRRLPQSGQQPADDGVVAHPMWVNFSMSENELSAYPRRGRQRA